MIIHCSKNHKPRNKTFAHLFLGLFYSYPFPPYFFLIGLSKHPSSDRRVDSPLDFWLCGLFFGVMN